MKLALDTNTYRDFFEGKEKSVSLVRAADSIALPIPVLAELRYGFLNGSKGLENEAFLQKFLQSKRVRLLECTEETASLFAELKFQLKKQGTPIPLNDVWIAALVIQYGFLFHTRDSDFDHLLQLPRV